MNQEIEIIKSFVVKNRQERYLKLLSNEKGRKKFLQSLAHFKDFDEKYIQRFKPNKHNQFFISDYLIRNGDSENCYLISEKPEMDTKQGEITIAISEVLGYGIGTIVSVIPGRLAYYEGEDERFFLKK